MDRMANTWTFEYYDGADWQTADSQSNETSWGASEQRVYDVSSVYTAQRWRLNISANDGDGSYLQIAEVEMMEASTYDSNDKLAQSFEISSGNTVETIKLWLKKVGSPTGNLTLTIETDSGGDPSGTPVTNGTSHTVAASTLSTAYGWIEFTFATNPTLSGTTTYWLVLSTSDSADEFNYVTWGADDSVPSYADGEMKSYASAAWSAESADACFIVNGSVTNVYAPLVCGAWDAGTRDIATRFASTTYANLTTNVTFKNVTGDTITVCCVVVLR